MADTNELWFSAYAVESAPPQGGLYAWYAVPVAGPPDWKEFYEDGHDVGGVTFARFLASHTRRLRYPPLQLRADSLFWARWQGSIEEAGLGMLARRIEDLSDLEDDGNGEGPPLSVVLRNAATRELLAKILVDASPRLSAPIYIGIAGNLRQRLKQHVDAFAQADEDIATTGSIRKQLLETFGGRARTAGLRLDDLRVGVLVLEGLDAVPDEEARRVISAAEFVLNRWHRPIFGRR